MAVHVDHFTEEEQLLLTHSLEDVLRHARAKKELDEEEESAVQSARPTVPVFLGEPWR